MRGAAALVVTALVLSGCAVEPAATTATDTPRTAAPTTTPASAAATTPTSPATAASDDDAYAERRNDMVDNQIVSRLVEDEGVIAAMRAVPRHEFVPDEFDGQAYNDHPLPIGHGQTISQPYIVAVMSEELEVVPGDRVLEIGTGSGYQAAVLAEMGVEVYTIEIIEELAAEAEERLQRLGYDATVRHGDGYFGWEEHAPFDAIIVTAAPDHLPQPLVDQLAPGGRMVIPIGPIGAVQTLWRFVMGDDGEVTAENLGAVRFVPFTRD